LTAPVTSADASPPFSCPRCARPVTPSDRDADRFYGPCASCRAELRAKYGQQASAGAGVEEAFEPKMNVVPNQVAMKD
jgi:hypothetical protein